MIGAPPGPYRYGKRGLIRRLRRVDPHRHYGIMEGGEDYQAQALQSGALDIKAMLPPLAAKLFLQSICAAFTTRVRAFGMDLPPRLQVVPLRWPCLPL